MTRLVALWIKEAIALSRDRHGLLALFLMPAIFILVMTVALRDVFAPGAVIDAAWVAVDQDRSPHSQQLIHRLEKSGAFRRLADPADEGEARAGIAAGRQALALVVPAGFGERLLTPGGVDGGASRTLQVFVDPTLNPALQLAFRNQIMAALGGVRADELTHRAGELFGLPTPKANGEREWPDEIATVAVLADGQPAGAMPSSVQQNVPAWLIFAMFFVVIPISSIFIVEREHGTLQRLAAAGLPFRLVLAGKLLPFFVVNQVQAALMVLVGIHVVPLLGAQGLAMPDGVQLLGWWLVAGCVSLAAISWALLIASLARTHEQATVVGGVGNILMGAIGGVMVPKFVMPATMQKLALASPMAWALDGFHAMMLRHGSLADLLPCFAKLLAFAALALAAALWLNRSSSRP